MTSPSSKSFEKASTRIFAFMPFFTLLMCDSCTFVFTCIFEMSGSEKIFCRSRT